MRVSKIGSAALLGDLSAIAKKAWRYAGQGKRIKEVHVNRREWVRRIRGSPSVISVIYVEISTRDFCRDFDTRYLKKSFRGAIFPSLPLCDAAVTPAPGTTILVHLALRVHHTV